MSFAPSFDAAQFRATLGRFATGVTVVTAEAADGSPVGLTVSSFNSVSLHPPLVLWSLAQSSSSLPAMQQCERYVIHVLSAEQIGLARHFATAKASERFKDMMALARAPGGGLMLAGECAAWFECRNRSRYHEGDHYIMVGEVEHCGHSKAHPLVFHAGGFDLTPKQS